MHGSKTDAQPPETHQAGVFCEKLRICDEGPPHRVLSSFAWFPMGEDVPAPDLPEAHLLRGPGGLDRPREADSRTALGVDTERILP